MTAGEHDASNAGQATADASDAPRIESVSGTGVPVRGNDVDTDQIVPARYLKAVTFDGLGEYAFFDRRFTDDGEPTDHPFNDERFGDASVLVVNANFGCGSSREHAPQALTRWGIDAVVGESFAEIFAGNCLALGIPTVTADRGAVRDLQDWVEAHPDGEIGVDVAEGRVTFGERTVEASVDEGQRRMLVEGMWDTTALLRSNADAVRATARSLPYVDDEEIPEPDE